MSNGSGTDIVFDLVANPGSLPIIMDEMEDAIVGLQMEADKLSESMNDIVNPKDFEQGQGNLLRTNQMYMLLNSTMGMAGVSLGRFMGTLRTVTMASKLAESAGGGLNGIFNVLTASTKAFAISLGPIGWTLLAIGTAISTVSTLMKKHKDATEEAKKASDAFKESTKSLNDAIRDSEIALLDAQGKIYDAKVEKINQEYEKKKEGYINEQVAQEMQIRETVRNEEEMRRQLLAIDERYTRIHSLNYQLRNQLLKNAAEEKKKVLTEAAEREEQAQRESAYSIVESLKEEEKFFGKSAGAILTRRLQMLMMKTEEAEAAGALRDKLDAMKKEKEINDAHTKSMQDLNWQIDMNNAVLADNIEAQQELLVVKKMSAGLDRAKAEDEVKKEKIIEKQKEQIAQVKEDLRDQIQLQEDLNQANKVGLDQLYQDIQLAAARPDSTKSTSATIRSTENAPNSNSSTNQTGVVTVLEHIYSLLKDVKAGLPLVGALG